LNAKASTKLQVNIANDLNRSAQGLNIGEKRLLMLAISKLDSKAKPTIVDASSARAIITVSEMVQTYDLNADKAYQEAKKAAEGLMKRQVRLKPNDADSALIQWVGKSAYNKGEGWILIEFYYGLFPSLFELPKLFTSYKLSRASGLKSVYSWRLFELLMQFKGTGVLNIGIDDFNHALETPDSLRANFANLRNRVISPSVKEIKEKDGLTVNWEAIKAGRKVKALKFTFQAEKPETKSKPSTYRHIPPDAALEAVDKPMAKPEAKSAYNNVLSTASQLLQVPKTKLTKEQAEQEFSALSKLASGIGSTVEKLSSVQQKEAFKEYGFLK
jgi:plasmid replication initiation protein